MKLSNATFKLTPLALAFAGCMALTSGNVAANNIEGRITDSQNKVYFEGAQVKIAELNRTAVTARDGSFHFTDLPEGKYTLVINYIGSAEIKQSINVVNGKIIKKNFVIGGQHAGMDNIIVYGQRSGQAGAYNRQKTADNLLSVVSSDAIGQLPDQNAAEALQRLPGMFIQRDQGEGRFVGIRGIDPNLNNVSINGLNVPSPEAGIRSVAMDVIPSELISSLEVSKTVTPDMDASAIGGSIEVKSLSAFDRENESYSFTAQTSYNALVEENSPKFSGSYTNVYQLEGNTQLGVAGAVSWFQRKFGSDNMETDGGWGDIEVEDSQTGDDVEIFGAEEIEQRDYVIERERLGFALNFDLHTSATDKYYLRTLYSEFSDDEFRLRKEYKFEKGELVANNSTTSSAQFINAEMDRDTKDRYETQEILSLVLGGENQINHWLVEYNLGYSQSTEKEPNRIDADFAGEDLSIGYTAGEYPVLSQSAEAQDLSNFELDEIVYANNLSEDEEVSVKLDLTKDFVWNNHNAQFKFGGKYRSREKFNDVDTTIYDGGFGDINAQQFNNGAVEYNLGEFGSGLSESAIKKYFFANQANFDINQNETDIENKGNSYTSNEDIFAAYAMLTLDIDNWHIVTGLRYEKTNFETSGNKVGLVIDDVNDNETVNIDTWHVEKDYDYLLPSLNVKYTVNEQLITRFAFTQTIARPTFGDSAAFQLIETEITEDNNVTETERKAEVGNPELDPYESNNFDISVEYYPEQIGVISAGLFYKDIDNFIVQQEVQDNGQWDGFDEVVQFVNGGSASLTGVELAWNKTFDSGLLLGANGTFIDADEQLPNQADTVGNLMIGYENNKLSVRLSASYKSESFQFNDGDFAVEEDTHMQLDFGGKYYVNENIQVYFNAINLTDEAYYLYHGSRNYNYQYEEYGRSFELGMTFSSF